MIKNNINKVELLAPAGSFEALKQAVHAGADAIYLGGKAFGARASAGNFSRVELAEAIEYAHIYGVKIYATVNTLVYEKEIDTFLEYVEYLVSIDVDALIVQDIGMAKIITNTYDIEIHASTQMHNYSLSNLEYLRDNKISRAVIARETPIADIEKMAQIMDVEVFIHGALCICYSGQCLFSAMELARSGNRGECAQACRMKYGLDLDGNPVDTDGDYLLSTKDLATLEDVTKIIAAGATSLKIEGRMKSPQYVGYVTKIYRDIIDCYYSGLEFALDDKRIETLQRLFNRGFTKGHIFNEGGKELMSTTRPNHKGVLIGKVTAINKETISILLSDTLHQGDGVKFEHADKGFICNRIYGSDGKLVNMATARENITLDNTIKLSVKDNLLLTLDSKLKKELSSYEQKKIPIKINALFAKNEPIRISISDDMGNVSKYACGKIEKSISAPLTKESIENSLAKLGSTPFELKEISISMDEGIFASKKDINMARRDACDKLIELRKKREPRDAKEYSMVYSAPKAEELTISCSVHNQDQLEVAIKSNIDRIYIDDIALYNKYKDKYLSLYYALPMLSTNAQGFTGERIKIVDTGGIKYCGDNEVACDYMLNITNSTSLALMHKYNAKWVCISPEISVNSVNKIIVNYQLKYDNLPNIEMLIYGRCQLMMINHCMIGTSDNCNECKKGDYDLEDILTKKYPVKKDDKCNNYIYSAQPIDYIGNINFLKAIKVNGFRLDFLDETPQEMNEIIKRVKSSI